MPPAGRFDSDEWEVTPIAQGGDWEVTDLPAAVKDVPWYESALRGAEQGLTYGTADELGGGLQAGLHELVGDDTEFIPTYREARDENRKRYDEAREANKGAYMAGEIAGGVISPVNKLLAPAKAVGGALRLGEKLIRGAKSGAAMGAAYGAGASDADLTKGEVGELAIDTGIGGLLGTAGGAAGEFISAGVNRLRGAAQNAYQKAFGEVVQKEADKAAGAVKSAAGGLGGNVSAGRNAVEVLQEIVESPTATPAMKLVAKKKLAEAQAVLLQQGVYENALGAFDKRLGDIASGRAELSAAQAANTPEAIAQGAGDALSDVWGQQVKPRLATIGNRLLPPALGYIAGEAFGDHGGVGAGLGAVYSTLRGRPVTILQNLAKSPEARTKAFGAITRLLGEAPEQLGKFAAPLAHAAQKGEQALKSWVYVLAQRSPEFRDMWARLGAGEKDGASP